MTELPFQPPTIEPVWGARAVGTPEYNNTYGQMN